MDPGRRHTAADPADPFVRLHAAGVVPVIVIDDAGAAAPLADALLAAGLPCVEITLRTDAALPALRALARHPSLLAGAGTVLDPGQVDRCVSAGARFIVSPGFDAAVVDRCQRLGVAVLPGAATATEILRARRHGLHAVKFFPAEQAGGQPALAALAQAIPDMGFVPTGGVGPGNAEQYLHSPRVLAVGGSWMAPRSLLAAGDWAQIRERCAGAARVAAARPRLWWP